MKKYYKFGEIIMALREEYKEYNYLLAELNKCIKIDYDYGNYYFEGILADKYKPQELGYIRLYVEKKYFDILKKINFLKYDWYSQFLYSAYFKVFKKDNGLYELNYDNIPTPVDGKKYIPNVEIIDQNNFSSLIDVLLSTDLMQIKEGNFSNNHDRISLNFNYAYIFTSLGDNSFISWDGINDDFNYSITRHNSPALIGDILSLEIPADKISSDWLQLLEKHENDFSKDILFDVDISAQSREGFLQVSSIENNRVVKLLKKVK